MARVEQGLVKLSRSSDCWLALVSRFLPFVSENVKTTEVWAVPTESYPIKCGAKNVTMDLVQGGFDLKEQQEQEWLLHVPRSRVSAGVIPLHPAGWMGSIPHWYMVKSLGRCVSAGIYLLVAVPSLLTSKWQTVVLSMCIIFTVHLPVPVISATVVRTRLDHC